MAVLARARVAAGISQRDLSAKLRRQINFAHYVENGERQLTVCEFIEYAEACGADPVRLLRRMRAGAVRAGVRGGLAGAGKPGRPGAV